MRKLVLVVEDEPAMAGFLKTLLPRAGFALTLVGDLPEARKRLEEGAVDVVLADLRLPSGDGTELLQARPHGGGWSSPPVVLMTAYGSVDSAVKAVKAGAYDYLTKPFDPERLLLTLEQAIQRDRLERDNAAFKTAAAPHWMYHRLDSESAAMLRVVELARSVAKEDTTVLLQGETGTGKEVMAWAIHDWSPRRDRPFVPIHCAGIPENLLESELFGYEKGAFTGAVRSKRGKIEMAEGGTLLLDEVGDMSPALQVKLLRVLEQRTFERLGGLQPVAVDTRIIAATNRDLAGAVADRRFRDDLYYRLSVFPIRLPPLRDRGEDIEELARQFLDSLARRMGREGAVFASDALDVMRRYAWPGNIRELKNVVERAIVLCKSGRIEASHLNLAGPPAAAPAEKADPSSLNFWDQEKALVLRAMRESDDNQSKAADLLGMTRAQLRKRLERYGLL